MWQESSENEQSVHASMTDVVFRIDCPRLRVDHAAALASAVCEHTAHLSESSCAGIHPIHVAGSQNGWERPEDASEYLLLSKRTRFRIRVEMEKAESLIACLKGVTLDVSGLPLHILTGQTRAIVPAATLFSRYTFFGNANIDNDEDSFINEVYEQCKTKNFLPTKILCGRVKHISTANSTLLTRSVLLADVPAPSSIVLQHDGLGEGRLIGCGLLIPHKDTGAAN